MENDLAFIGILGTITLGIIVGLYLHEKGYR